MWVLRFSCFLYFRDFLGVLLLGLLFLLGVSLVISKGFLGVHSFGFSLGMFLWVFFKIFAGSSVPPAATFLAEIKSSNSAIFLWKSS